MKTRFTAAGSLRRVRIAPLLAALVLLGLPQAAHAATFTVTKTTDSIDGSCDADCSLREAVIAANEAAGTDTIVIPPGHYLLSIPGTDENASADGDLDITGDSIVTGAGAAATIIDANGEVTDSRALHILTGTTVTITGVTVTGGNELGDAYPNAGGGIFINEATMFTLTDSAVTGNRAEYWSGGLDIEGPSLLQNVTVSNNVAGRGAGGAEVETSGVTMVNVTVSGNRANEEGGGLALNDPGTTLNNVTIVGNVADADNAGGGDTGGGLYMADDTIIRNSIVSGNSVGGAGAEPDCTDENNYLTSLGSNVVQSPGSCAFNGPGDKPGVDPKIGPLADNGGFTQTHALLKGSPAIGAADPATAAPTDQRGLTRNDPDIGAYERVLCARVPVNRIGTGGKDRLVGTKGPDGMLGFAGKDTLIGKGGKDGLCGGPGKDLLKGGGGKDRLKGQGGKDVCIGGPGKDGATTCEREKTI